MKKNPYYIKTDKKKFFYPEQWIQFYNSIEDKQKAYFKIAINTGARINEIRNLKVKHIDFEREGLTFYTTKIKAKKKQNRPEPREIKISSQLTQWFKERINKYNLGPEDTFNIKSTQAIDKFIKKRLEKLGFENPKEYSSHNIRKTFIMYLRLWSVDAAVIAEYVGHDIRTTNTSYSKPNLMNENDARIIRKKIIGNIIDKLSMKIQIKELLED